uniref:Uncharacterized protein n=1 Tax=Anguilla anguilla TaxID=7936 RepID=A0A0E9XZV4_ANGAN
MHTYIQTHTHPHTYTQTYLLYIHWSIQNTKKASIVRFMLNIILCAIQTKCYYFAEIIVLFICTVYHKITKTH